MSDYRIIQTASECNLPRFKACLFDEKYSVLIICGKPPQEEVLAAWENIYMQYNDLSGTGKGEELAVLVDINTLDARIRSVNLYVSLNQEAIAQLFEPYYPTFNDLRRFGHRLKWDKANPDINGFISQLKSIEVKEARYKADLDSKIKELMALKKRIQDGVINKPGNARKDFIRLINALGRQGFQINDSTTVEEFAVMVSDYSELCEKELLNKNVKGRR